MVKNRVCAPTLASIFAALLLFVALPGAALGQTSGLPSPSISNGSANARPNPTGQTVVQETAAPGGTDENYRLGTGDQLKVTVYGEDDLSGEFAVDGSGQIQLPLIGQVKAADLTVHQFIAEVQQILGAKYLRDPRVSVQIEKYRPFYIIGEVNRPGEYPCESRLSAFGAVALAGGFTFRADTRRVYVRRNGTGDEEEIPTNKPTRIDPGDIVRVAERLF